MLPCLVCGRLSKQSRCRRHRTRQARGYGSEHQAVRDELVAASPVCVDCGHTALHLGNRCGNPACKKCPLQADHVIPLKRIRQTGEKPVYAVRCRQCNRAKSDHYDYGG